MKCLILAGGFGRRVQPVIGDKPKALLEYLGKPLLSHIVEKVPHGIDIFVSTNKRFEADLLQWRETIKRPVEILVETAWSEEQKPGALSSISFWVRNKHIEEDLLVIASDNYFEFDLSRFMAAYNGKNTLVAAYDVGDKNKACHFGVLKLNGSKIVEFTEKPPQPSSTLVATACYIFPPRVLNICTDYCLQGNKDLLGNFIAHLVDTDEVFGFPFWEKWFDIGSEVNNGGRIKMG
jgi:glucose-1-phosphate thymidylyltransferase